MLGSNFKSARPKQSSPIKIKDYFENPTHKIKQPAFLDIGFSHFTLHTFVRTFTNRYSPHHINYTAVKEFIKNFTNNSPKLIQTYDDFFVKNFQITKEGNITIEHFLQFFTKQEKQKLQDFNSKSIKNLFIDLGKLNAENIVNKCEQLGVAMSIKQAEKMIKMLNYDAKVRESQVLKQQAFNRAIRLNLEYDE